MNVDLIPLKEEKLKIKKNEKKSKKSRKIESRKIESQKNTQLTIPLLGLYSF